MRPYGHHIETQARAEKVNETGSVPETAVAGDDYASSDALVQRLVALPRLAGRSAQRRSADATTSADHDTLLAAQRAIGNRNVQRLLHSGVVVQRRPALGHNTLELTAGGTPTVAGTTVAAPSAAAGNVRVTSPDVKAAPTTANLTGDEKLGAAESVQVGWVQSLLGSERTALYRSPGAQPGDPLIEQRNEQGAARDASRSTYGGVGDAFARAAPPWYVPPATLSDVHTSDTVRVAEGGEAELLDRPGFSVPDSIGSGWFRPQLVGTKGADRFITAFSAKYANAAPTDLFTMTSSAWSVDWTMDIDPLGAGTGAKGDIKPSASGPPTVEGEIAAKQHGKSWISFPTLGDAMMVPTRTLLANLAPAKANDAPSFKFTCDALRAHNPRISLVLSVDGTQSYVSSDDLTIEVTGDKGAVSEQCSLNDGDAHRLSFALLDLATPETIADGGQLTVRVKRSNRPAEYPIPWPRPFSDLNENFGMGRGKYNLITRLQG